MYESNRAGINKSNSGYVMAKQIEDKPLEKRTNDNSEIDIFPALQKYKDQHNTANLQKLCVEVLDFCRSIYASTQNENERVAFRKYMQKIAQI
jgi:hypothetical protein